MANPYYNDIEPNSVKLPYPQMLFTEFDKITDELVSICKKEAETYAQRAIFYKKCFKSFNNVYLRWLNVTESGTLAPEPVFAKLDRAQFQDRHFGFFFH